MNLEEQRRELARRAAIVAEYEALLRVRWAAGRPCGSSDSLVRRHFSISQRRIQRWRAELPRERRRLSRLARGQFSSRQRAGIGRRLRAVGRWAGAPLKTLYRWRERLLRGGVLALADGRSLIVVRRGGGRSE